MPDPTRGEEGAKDLTFQDDEATRALMADLERELGVTGTAAVFRKALAIAKQAASDARSADGEALDEEIELHCEAMARATTAESEVARLAAEVARVEAERDRLLAERQNCDARIRNQRAVLREWGPGSRLEIAARSRLMLIGLVRKKSEALRAAEASASALRERVAVLEKVLKPFAIIADCREPIDKDRADNIACFSGLASPVAGQFRAARAALKESSDA